MDTRLVLVPLPEDSSREPTFDGIACVIRPTKPNRFVKSKLGAGKNTNRRCVTDWIVNRFETDRATSEIVADQFVCNDCGAGLSVI